MSAIASNPYVYQALAIAKGLETYARFKMKMNRAWTPSAMMWTAAKLTGQDFAPRDYLGAAKALRQAIDMGKFQL